MNHLIKSYTNRCYNYLKRLQIAFLIRCIELKHIPRGFLLKFHSNSNNASHKFILENGSRKFVISTVAYCKKLLPPLKVQLDTIKTIINGK